MALYRYVKDKPPVHRLQSKPKKKARFPVTSALLMVSGVFMILWVVWPIISFELLVSPNFSSIIRPIPDSVIAQAMENTDFGSILGSSTVDYTRASNWFPKSQVHPEKKEANKVYYLSIPKLNIEKAHVSISGDDLNKSLIHYGGTALPGEYGNGVVFGHSVLPAFFNPKNYLTIFSLLPTLKEGDEIFTDDNKIKYRYVVSEMKVVSPDDVSVLEQKYDWAYLSLVTCVPPGTYWKRLIVRARLEKIR